jgi:phage terminase small subunit
MTEKKRGGSRRPTAIGITPREEAFALAYVDLGSGVEAYLKATGSTCKRDSAIQRGSELLQKPVVKERIEAIRRERERLLHERFQVTKERILQEYARIGFADIRSIIKWDGASPNPGEDGGAGNNVLVLTSSKEISDDVAAAISEISQSDKGALKIKLHSKLGALDSMAKHLGMFTEKVEMTGKDGTALVPENSSTRDLARAILGILRDAQTEQPQDETEDED